MNIKKGDKVVVLSGKSKGKEGKVLATYPKTDKVIVEGVNMATKHKKPRKAGETGGIIHQEAPIHACKVMNICTKCSKPTRIARQVIGEEGLTRVCKHCGETL